jgi:hypothetical protein
MPGRGAGDPEIKLPVINGGRAARSLVTWRRKVGPEAIEEMLRGLQPYAYGWRSDLPMPHLFFGHAVALEIETRPFPAADPPLLPSQTEVELARLILAGLSKVLAEAERRYAAYSAETPDVLAKVHRPRVWICREFQDREGRDWWALEAGISDAPDWSLFIEFRGLEFVEVWSGD